MPRLCAHLSICLAVVSTAAGAMTPEQMAALYRPFLAEQVTLSSDGQHVAYTEHANNELHVVIMNLEPPYAKVTLAVDDDQDIAFSKEKRRATLRFLRWATANRLVFAPMEQVFSLATQTGAEKKYVAPIMAVDADGKNPRMLARGSDFMATVPIPGGDTVDKPRANQVVGFPPNDRQHLLVQGIGYVFWAAPPPIGDGVGAHAPSIPVQVIVPTTLFKIDVTTGKRTESGDEFFAGNVGYDRQGHARLSYAKPERSLDRSFALLEKGAPKFDGPWLGPLAGHFTVSPKNYFGERAFPLGFDADPDVLFVASNIGRDTFGIYAFNVKTKQRLPFALEDSHVDLLPLEPEYPGAELVYDEFSGQVAGVHSPGPRPVSRWCDESLAAAQANLEKKFPGRTVELLEWNEARTAFLVRVTGGSEPGRYFVHRSPENLGLEILRSAPWLPTADLHATEDFAFDTAAGVHLTGYITVPGHPRLNPPPAVVKFADGFPASPQPEFDREAQVLASMGLVVIRLNHRGVGGFGVKHRNAIIPEIDRVPVDDALEALAWVAARHPIDRKRVATLGTGFGGYLAVRALQLHPEAFRCAVVTDAPLDPARWVRPEVSADMGVALDFTQEVNRAFLEGADFNLRALSVLARPETLTHPVFQIVTAGRADAVESANRQLRSQLKRLGDESDYIEVEADYAAELPAARARVYERLEEFFNLNLYDYKVKVGPTKEVK